MKEKKETSMIPVAIALGVVSVLAVLIFVFLNKEVDTLPDAETVDLNSKEENTMSENNIEDFEFDKLLSHPNPEVRAFNFIVITKCTTKGNTTTVRPLMIIYNKNDWKVRCVDIEDYYGSRTKTLCSNRKQTLDFAGKLIELPCNNQNAIINKFNIISKILIAKNKIKGKSLIRKK